MVNITRTTNHLVADEALKANDDWLSTANTRGFKAMRCWSALASNDHAVCGSIRRTRGLSWCFKATRASSEEPADALVREASLKATHCARRRWRNCLTTIRNNVLRAASANTHSMLLRGNVESTKNTNTIMSVIRDTCNGVVGRIPKQPANAYLLHICSH